MRIEPRNAAIAEEVHPTDHRTYAPNVADLVAVKGAPFDRRVHVSVARADREPFCLGVTGPGRRCTTTRPSAW